MCLGTILKDKNISCQTFIKHFNRFSLLAKMEFDIRMDHVFFSWSFLELLNEALLCNFLCCTAASGPYLITNRKGLILHKQNIDDMVKSLNGGAVAHTVLTELNDQKLFRRGMASIKSTPSYVL